jgi:hypothetical protein
MPQFPYEVAKRLAEIPDGKPFRFTINANGRGEWKTEVTFFDGVCTTEIGEEIPCQSAYKLTSSSS